MTAKNPKVWCHWNYVIEEDFESRADRTPTIFVKNRTGYLIRSANYAEWDKVYLPGKYRTLRDAKNRIEELLKEGGE
jgi:hypothetical protein